MKGRIYEAVCLLAVIVCECGCLTIKAGNNNPGDTLVTMFWNLENFYDYFDDGANSSDSEFSASGAKHWTKKRFTAKCNAFGKTVLGIASKYEQLPAAIGVAEVENAFVLRRIVDSDVLHKCGYRYVHYDSPDKRGIDVALLYRSSAMRLLCSRPVHVRDEKGNLMRTRDILYAKFLILHVMASDGLDSHPGCSDADTLHIIVNHHPSKFSGSRSSAAAREAAMRELKVLCDSITACSSAPMIITGDFNDTPDGEQFSLLGNQFVNLAAKLSESGEGSIRFNGRYELIDHFIVPARETEKCRMQIYDAPFLLEQDKAHTGWKPHRTYSGPRYLGGVSDHLPIVLLYK